MSIQGASIIYMELDEVSVRNSEEFDDTLTHLWCECKGDTVGLCGVDLSDADVKEDADDSETCVVCVDMDITHDAFCSSKETNNWIL